MTNSLKEYNDLLISSLTYSNASVSDDLEQLLASDNSLPIIYSSVRCPIDLHHLIQFILDRNILHVVNDSNIEHLFLNFTEHVQRYRLHVLIFLNTHGWFDYIASSTIHLIVHSWPDDASCTCLYTTIVRHQQLDSIFRIPVDCLISSGIL